MITVVGLGCKKGQLTLEGAEAIKQADKVFVKTQLTDTYTYFTDQSIDVQSLDFIYEQSGDFDNLDRAIVRYVIENSSDKNTVYCVNGSGLDDRSVIALCQECEVKIIPSVSRGIACAKPCVGVLTISAYELTSLKGFNYDTRLSLTVTDVDNAFIAGEVKLVLENILGDEEKIYFSGKEIMVYELDRQKTYDYSSVVFAPAKELVDKKRFNFIDLYLIMRILRGENGCQWDKAQTHQSIRENAIEEAYELVEAINNEDIDNMIEESGDLFLQSIFHCVIGEDNGEFNVEDSLSGICSKLISRHTHIFGDVVANNAEEALKAWDAAKAKEKKYKSQSDKMQHVARALPALMRAEKVQKAAAKGDFEFNEYSQVLDKIKEEYGEFVEAQGADVEKEGGDLLFACVNALRWKGVDSEVALQGTIDKFARRYSYVEEKCGGSTAGRPLEELDKLWEEAKKSEG